jgi:hypothetical protein
VKSPSWYLSRQLVEQVCRRYSPALNAEGSVRCPASLVSAATFVMPEQSAACQLMKLLNGSVSAEQVFTHGRPIVVGRVMRTCRHCARS